MQISLLAKSLTGEEVARELLSVLSTELGISASHVLAAMRDRASVSYAHSKKSGSLLFGNQKMQFTTLWSKKKDDDCYFEPEKLVHSYLELEKCS